MPWLMRSIATAANLGVEPFFESVCAHLVEFLEVLAVSVNLAPQGLTYAQKWANHVFTRLSGQSPAGEHDFLF